MNWFYNLPTFWLIDYLCACMPFLQEVIRALVSPNRKCKGHSLVIHPCCTTDTLWNEMSICPTEVVSQTPRQYFHVSPYKYLRHFLSQFFIEIQCWDDGLYWSLGCQETKHPWQSFNNESFWYLTNMWLKGKNH